MSYILDANTFIEAKNCYYGMNICPGYWDWLIDKSNSDQLISIEMVRSELERGSDELAIWVKANRGLFKSNSDNATQVAYATVANHVAAILNLKSGALEEFLRGADPWLIAKAIATSFTIVTHEQYKPESRKKILIPNVCKHFGITCIDTFELLEHLKAKFVQHVPPL